MFNDAPLEILVAIRNELSNDGLLYVKHVKPIFQETLSSSISFFSDWQKEYNTSELFMDNLDVIQR